MNERLKKILITILLIIMAFTICYQCSTNPFISKEIGTDSNVFIYIAKSMQDGIMPYRDIFDHKGPLLYLINYIGLIIGNNTYVGIWIIEILFMVINLIYMYKISKMFIKNDFLTLIPIIITMIPISNYLQGGNLTEEYALPFIIISLYYMIKYLVKTNKIEKTESFIIGTCMGFVLLLRPNMITLWIIYCSIIFIDMIIKKKYNEAKNTVIFFLLGVATVIVVSIIILQIQGILIDCIKDYIIFNFSYIGKGQVPLVKCMNEFLKNSRLFIVSIIICMYSISYKIVKKEKEIILPISSLIYSIFTISIITLSRRNFLHYAIVLIPTFLVPLLIFTQILKNVKYKKITLVVGILLTLLLIRNNIKTTMKIYKNIDVKAGKDTSIINIIKQKTTEKDRILVIGNKCSIYIESDRKSASKYAYQKSLINIDNEIKKEVENDIKSCKSKLLICTKQVIEDEKNIDIKKIIDDLLESSKYKRIKELDKYTILEREDAYE